MRIQGRGIFFASAEMVLGHDGRDQIAFFQCHEHELLRYLVCFNSLESCMQATGSYKKSPACAVLVGVLSLLCLR